MDTDKIHDEFLILRCQARDEAAFQELVERWEPSLYYYLRRIARSESDVWDILQETWLAVFKSIRKLRDPHKFPSWLYKIARNQASSWFRKERKYDHVENDETANHLHSANDFALASERADLVHKLLAGLRLPYREVITLYFLQEFSIKEIGEIIGMPDGTVRSRLHYAKKKIREALEKENGG